MSRLIFLLSILLVGAALLWSLVSLRRRLKSGGARLGELSLEAALPLGPQKRLLSVKWKDMDLLIAESGASIELLSSTILRTTNRRDAPDSSRVSTPDEFLSVATDTRNRCPEVAIENSFDGPCGESDATVTHAPVNFSDLIAAKTTATRPSDTAEIFHA